MHIKEKCGKKAKNKAVQLGKEYLYKPSYPSQAMQWKNDWVGKWQKEMQGWTSQYMLFLCFSPKSANTFLILNRYIIPRAKQGTYLSFWE